ncbi:hypothetical protein SEA_DARTHPHADER_55 [Mycobacterium phage DarthPhader]|uniref:Uncharacterized protein n=1 Tax=Mycobacterium phage DarthPhader TaxID=1912975 RepID=A0A1I9S401_9CAUD|nr:hypothetical protein KIV60_gp46 [Mycobacterium phage DarthPhader]AOZ61295.1 hypothetical protein SEA_DARTHPHADER_55 [Mycobacterium phage DarthPhader]
MYELSKRTFDTWAEIPTGVLVKGKYALYIKLSSEQAAFTADVDSMGGWNGGWISAIPSFLEQHAGPFTAVAVAV